MMTWPDCISLAKQIRDHNHAALIVDRWDTETTFGDVQVRVLADFLQTQCSTFRGDQWMDYALGFELLSEGEGS